jgi:hypothetical protein
MAIPAKVSERISSGVKKFQTIIKSAKDRDVKESDTVLIVTDILNEVLGYDKYSEITTEQATRQGNFCDIALKLNDKMRIIIEVKAIGLELKEAHVKQAADYGASEKVEWVILTNALTWQIYKVPPGKPFDKEFVYEFKFLDLNFKAEEDINNLFYFSKEGIGKDSLEEIHSQKQVLSRYFVGQMILTDTVIDTIKRELKRIAPGVKIESEGIRKVIEEELFKREALENERAGEAKKTINDFYKKLDRQKAKEQSNKKVETHPEKENNEPESEVTNNQ